MIKKYNQYINESLLDKIEGPNEQEIIDTLIDNPNKLLRVSLDANFIEGINIALEHGAKIKNLGSGVLYGKLFKILKYSDEKIISTLQDEKSILDYAYEVDNRRLIKYALERGAYFSDDKLNTMYYEVPELFKYLCENVDNFNVSDSFIRQFIYSKRTEDIKKLINMGAFNINEDGLRLLKNAVFIGSKEIVQLFLDYGVKIPSNFNFSDIMYEDIEELLKNNIEK